MSDTIKKVIQNLDDQRLALLKEGRKSNALSVQRAMMQTDRTEAHKLINASRGGGETKVSADGVYGRYSSRSGVDITAVVDAIPAFEPRKKKRGAVTSSHKAVLDHITANTYAELQAMSDEDLNSLFGQTAVERQWLEEEGAPINPKANSKTVRRKTRKLLEQEAVPVPIELNSMTRLELDEVAKAKGIDPAGLSKKEDVIAAIIESEDLLD